MIIIFVLCPSKKNSSRCRIEWALDGTDTFSFTYHSLHTVMLTMYCHFLFCFRKKHLAPGRCIFLIHNFQESSFWKQTESTRKFSTVLVTESDAKTVSPTISALLPFPLDHQEIPQISKHKSIFGSSFFILI